MRLIRALGIVVLIALVLAAVQALRGVPKPSLQLVRGSATIAGPRPVLPWPATGEAAVYVEGVGTMGSSGGNSPVPIGSVAKIMTAWLVLQKHPLAPGAQGPRITVTAAQAAAYAAAAHSAQSLVQVVAGERLSEYQLLQALLVPSGNNIAGILADWVAGSQQAFVRMMNQQAKALGMRQTTYADSSGLSQATVSTANDQLILARRAMANPVFAHIVGEPQVVLPTVGLVYNYNNLVGHHGVIGIKTGSTLAAGGCFVFAARRSVDGQPITVLGAVLGQGERSIQPLQTALNRSLALADAAARAVVAVRPVAAGQTVAVLSAPWQRRVAVAARGQARFLGWGGLRVSYRLQAAAPQAPVRAGTDVGRLSVTVGRQQAHVALRTAARLESPPWRWRLLRL